MATKAKRSKKTNTLNVAFLLDMSGSMSVGEATTREAVHGYLVELQAEEAKLAKKKAGTYTHLSFTCFDTRIERWEVNRPVAELDPKALTRRWQPRGATALYDSIAQTIVDMEAAMIAEKREHEKVLVVIMTDGLENASQEYSLNANGRERIMKLVKRYEKKGNWTFVFMGNEQALAEAQAIGIAPGNVAVMDYSSSDSVYAVASATGIVTSTLRSHSGDQTSTAFADAGLGQDYRDPESSSSK